MRIKKLDLKDFRNHQQSTLELDQPFIVIRGSNYSGKSSIAQAISMCLTPSTMGLDATGRGFMSKIRRGQPKAVITADIQGGKHVVQNAVTLNTNTTGRTSRAVCIDDPSWHPSPFERILDNNRAALTVALNTDAFMLMDEKAQKTLLAKLALPAKYDFPPEKIAAVEKTIGEGVIDFDGEPFAVIDKAYKKLYDERQSINRYIKEFVIPETLGVVAGATSADLQLQLDDATAMRQKLQADRDKAQQSSANAKVKRVKLVTKIEELESRVREGQAQSKDATQRMLSETKLKDLRKMAEAKTALDGLERERTAICGQIDERQAEIQQYGATVEVGAECPTCGQPINKEHIAAMVGTAAKAQADLRNKDRELLTQMKVIGDVDGAIKAIADHEVAVRERNTLEALIAEKQKQLKDAASEMKSLQPDDPDAQKFDVPLAEAEEKATKLMLSLRPVIAAEERDKEIAAKTEQLKKLTEKAATLNELVAYFDKDGIKTKLLADHISDFESKMNMVMKSFGYSCALSIEPYQFEVTDTKDVTTPVKELSGSEQLMFSVALQCAVSRVAGIGIVVADRMDTFLPAQRQKANVCLYNAVKDGLLEQVILIVSDETETAPKLPNAAFFLVDNGTVRRL